VFEPDAQIGGLCRQAIAVFGLLPIERGEGHRGRSDLKGGSTVVSLGHRCLRRAAAGDVGQYSTGDCVPLGRAFASAFGPAGAAQDELMYAVPGLELSQFLPLCTTPNELCVVPHNCYTRRVF
jgi:hypothetical protein